MAGKMTPGNMAETLGTEGHLSGQEDEPLGECRWARHLCLMRCVDVPLKTSHQVSFWAQRSRNAAAEQVGPGSWSEHRTTLLSCQVLPVLQNHAE